MEKVTITFTVDAWDAQKLAALYSGMLNGGRLDLDLALRYLPSALSEIQDNLLTHLHSDEGRTLEDWDWDKNEKRFMERFVSIGAQE